MCPVSQCCIPLFKLFPASYPNIPIYSFCRYQIAMAEQEWSHNLCSMDSCSSCCGTIWCSPCIYGRTAWRLEQYPQDPSSSSGFEWCNAPCLGMFAGWLLLIPCIPVWMQRNIVRKRFNLPGNGCTDCLVGRTPNATFSTGA